ncbi:5-methyltetrahydropteroyltriglutamate--homocysteine S-methyltransferase [Sarracenia purpurea var. burkii]
MGQPQRRKAKGGNLVLGFYLNQRLATTVRRRERHRRTASSAPPEPYVGPPPSTLISTVSSNLRDPSLLGIETVPVLVGPVSYLLLSKSAKGVEKSFSLLSLIDNILPVYKEVVTELKEAGVSWIQFDEPTLVMDLESHKLQAFSHAYSELASSVSGSNVLIETYFADVPAEAYKTLTALKGVTGFGFDLVCGTKTLNLINGGFPSGKYLFAGVVDGRNIWANDLTASLGTLQDLEGIVGKDKIVVSTSFSLLHTAVDLVNETKLDKEIKSWLAFAAQKVVEVNALAKALSGHEDEVFSFPHRKFPDVEGTTDWNGKNLTLVSYCCFNSPTNVPLPGFQKACLLVCPHVCSSIPLTTFSACLVGSDDGHEELMAVVAAIISHGIVLTQLILEADGAIL